jgi:hypothetical protein
MARESPRWASSAEKDLPSVLRRDRFRRYSGSVRPRSSPVAWNEACKR